MLERFKRTGKDSSPSGAVATSERPRDEDTRVADGTHERGETRTPAGAAGSTGATRPIEETGAGNGDTVGDSDANDEREARRRERENRRAQRRDGGAGGTGGAAAAGGAAAGAAAGGTTAPARGDDTTATEEGEAARPVGRAALTRDALKTARARQRDEFGGLNWGASFFGWLVAVGVAAIILALLAAAGAAIGLTTQDANVDSLGLGGGIALLAALMLAYFCGGYVAGRMSRFDGARQGAGVWIIAFVITVALALLAIIAGDKYNVLAQLGLPSIPVGESELRSGGWIALLAVVVGTFVAAVVGGKWGERYHARVDRAGFID
jgi:hypothetical protein